MEVKIKFLNDKAKMPYKKHSNDLGLDCYATSIKDLGDGRIEYGLGIALQIDDEMKGFIETFDRLVGFEIVPRSSIHKTGLLLSNSVGQIDMDYSGEIKAVFYNIIKELPNYEIGDRICQLKVTTHEPIKFVEVDELEDTERGNGGYGSTGLK